MLPSSDTIRTGAIGIALFLAATIIAKLIEANVVELAKRRGWDSVLVRLADWMPAGMRRMIAGWSHVKQQWWVWLCLGITFGFGVAPNAMQTLGSIIQKAIQSERAAPFQGGTDNKATEGARIIPEQNKVQQYTKASLVLFFKSPGIDPEELSASNAEWTTKFIPEQKPCESGQYFGGGSPLSGQSPLSSLLAACRT